MSTTTFQDSIEESIKEKAEQLGERLEPHIRQGKRQLATLNQRARSFINDHPAACLFGALALGYVVARMARRERS